MIFVQDGSITEIHGLNLLFATLRGIVLMSEERPARGQKNEAEFQYYKKTIKLPKPPKFLILDSKGYIHVFRYYDTRYAFPALSMFIRLLSIQEFQDKQVLLMEKLNRKKKRSKSVHEKVETISLMKEKKRSKSQVPLLNSSSEPQSS